MAVNSTTHLVYVADTGNRRIDEFDPSKPPPERFVRAWGWGVSNGAAELQVCTVSCRQGLSGSAPGEFQTPTFIAVDNSAGGEGDVYIGDTGTNLVSKFSSEGTLVGAWGNNGPLEKPNGQLTGLTGEPFGPLVGIVVDAVGNLWVDAGKMFAFERTGGFLGVSWGTGGAVPSGIAIDSSFNLYLANGELNVLKFTAEGSEVGRVFPFSGSLATGLALDTITQELYLDSGSQIEIVQPGCPPPSGKCTITETFGSPQLAGGAGLAVDSQSHAVYVADTTGERVDVFVLEPAAPPMVTSEFVSKVTDQSASFSASVDPHGVSTHYRFEYGPCTTPSTCETSPYGTNVPVPDGFAGADFESHAVGPESISGLVAGTRYHFRLVAQNALGIETGADQTFTTQITGGEPELPDNRRWELVSPPDKHAALIEPLKENGVIQAAESGDAITYLTSASTEEHPQGNAIESQILSTRGPTGWETKDIAEPHESASGLPLRQTQYQFFSPDLSIAALQPFGPFSKSFSPEASERTPFLRSDYTAGGEVCPTAAQKAAGVSCFQPLVTGKAGFANVPEGNVFTNEAEGGEAGPGLAAASTDLKHVVIASTYGLTAPGKTPPGSHLYEWTGGKLTFIGENEASVYSVSDDGSRVLVQPDAPVIRLLLRDLPLGQTIRLDLPEPGCLEKGTCGEGKEESEFQGATGDGSKYFFTDTRRLTADAGAAETRDLYECDVVVEAGALRCQLHDLTPPGSAKESAQVLRHILGMSSDGSWVYFAANGDLAGGVAHGACGTGQEPVFGASCNLYVRHGGVTKLIATLRGDDQPDWNTPLGAPPGSTARVSPGGEWLAFMSDAKPTGYDNRDVSSGQLDEEVYLYDAKTGALVCPSCNPTGARPQGVEYEQIEAGTERTGLAGGFGVWESKRWLAANVPNWTAYETSGAVYQSRYLSDSGRLFFNSSDALVPQDVNHNEDVYQYEPPGIGSCTSGNRTFSAPSGGCVGLISSGESAEESAFMDASESGGDVFFLTSSHLSKADVDTSIDVYDAHECTPASPCPASVVSPPPCSNGDACKPAPSPQPEIFGSPASSTFSGAGNPAAQSPAAKPKLLSNAQKLARALKACRRKHARARALCERQARTRYGPRHKAKRSAHPRRGGKK